MLALPELPPAYRSPDANGGDAPTYAGRHPWPRGGGDPLLRCATFRNDANFAGSGVAGNRKWRLAPIEQAWQGSTLGEVCRQLLDPARSHMGRAELLHHMAHDELVGWGWQPGANRTPSPGTQAALARDARPDPPPSRGTPAAG